MYFMFLIGFRKFCNILTDFYIFRNKYFFFEYCENKHRNDQIANPHGLPRTPTDSPRTPHGPPRTPTDSPRTPQLVKPRKREVFVTRCRFFDIFDHFLIFSWFYDIYVGNVQLHAYCIDFDKNSLVCTKLGWFCVFWLFY